MEDDSIEQGLEIFRKAREEMVYALAFARAKLRAPAGRYREEELLEIRTMIREIIQKFPDLASPGGSE